jgi:radical SAM superfamily enzyme YgiQ (UPF0313 family)
VYKRDLRIEDYYIGYLHHPYVSLYTRRGCRSRCTFCLWPQTVGGHRYRTRSVAAVLEEAALARALFPQMKKPCFDDDTFTDDRGRAGGIARGLGRLGITWSCNAKANVPRDLWAVMRDNGLRLLLVGYESGDQQILINIKKGLRVERARRFAADCRDSKAPSSRRCPTRSSTGPRSSTRWTPFAGGSISGPARSLRCPPRCSAARR